jgi:tetratricopeptide (TPR) repeat protein
LIALIIALAISTNATAQTDWGGHTRTGEYAFARGDFARAEAEFRAALEIAQQLPAGDRRLEMSLENLARFYEHQSDFDQAQSLYHLLLAAQEMRLGLEDPGLLDTLLAVARTAQPSGDVPTVEESLTRYARIADATGMADPAQRWRALAMLARTETLQENPDGALRWQRQAVKALADDSGATETERADTIETLAHMELVAGEAQSAEFLLGQVAKLRTGDGGVNATASTMAQGAAVAFGAGEFETAEELALRALDASPNPEEELEARNVLADVSWIRVGRGADDVGDLLAAASEDEALVTASDRLRSVEALEKGTNPETLTRLVQVEARRGLPAEAAKWQRLVLESVQATSGPSSPAAIEALRNLITLLAAAGHTEEALAENGSILGSLESSFGEMDPRLVRDLEVRLGLLTELGRKKEAKAVRKRIKKLSR